jgi:hypothetical protein
VGAVSVGWADLDFFVCNGSVLYAPRHDDELARAAQCRLNRRVGSVQHVQHVTGGCCGEGVWGYHPLVVSLAKTQEAK